MAEYKVTLSQLQETSSTLKQQADAYLTAATELKRASDNLTSQGWQGEAAEAWTECITELHSWMADMSVAVSDFSKVLNEASDIYGTADKESAAKFGG